MKVYNFSAGPAMLPEAVMKIAQNEFCNYANSGSGIIELSHRGPQFTDILEQAEKNVRELMGISDEYAVCFIQGGASMQFAMIPMNLMGECADYTDTGTWANKAGKEAQGFGKVNIIASSKANNYNHIPVIRHWEPTPNASYLHLTSNNTVAGTQYHSFPPASKTAPIIADMSSDIMSRVVNVNDFGMIYAGSQKNIGPSGMALVIIRKDLAERVPATVPTMLQYKTYIEKQSMFNTPPTFAIYMVKLVTDWFKAQGGISAIEDINDTKSECLYETLDSSEFYSSPIEAGSRSKMNVVFRMPSEELEAKFVKEAAAQGMSGLKGHRSVGGIRASIYNAMPLAGVETLVDFMIEFEKQNG